MIKIGFRLLVVLNFAIIMLLFCNCTEHKQKAIFYNFPCNYAGPVLIEFNCPNYPEFRVDPRGNLIIDINSTGVIKTGTKFENYSDFHEEYYLWQCDKIYDLRTDHTTVGVSGVYFEKNEDNPEYRYDSVQGKFEHSFNDTHYYCFYASQKPIYDWDIFKDSLLNKQWDCGSLVRRLAKDNLRCE